MRRSSVRRQRFGRLTVVRELRGGGNHRRVIATCDCGSPRRTYHLENLVSHHTRSCGCLRREISAARCRVHGLTHTPTYQAWCAMKTRVLNPHAANHKWYKHVTITKRWLGPRGFLHFLQDMGTKPPGTTLGRIHDGNRYDKKHAEWQTPGQQGATKRLKKAA